MNKLGIQWQQEPPRPDDPAWPSHPIVYYNRLVQPTVLKSINGRTRAVWEGLRAENPGLRLSIYRHYIPDVGNFPWQDDPERQAREAVNLLLQHIGIPENRDSYLLDVIDTVECNNEFVHSFQHDLHPIADRYMAEFVAQAARVLGLKTVALNSACGHFAEELVDCFPRTWEALATHGGWIGMHEYDWSTMDRIFKQDGDYWLCGKYRKAVPPIRARYGDIPVVITECGVDGGVADRPMKGWRSCAPNEWEAMEKYLGDRSLAWYNALLNEDDYVDGAAIFIIRGYDDWHDFDIWPPQTITDRIAQFPGVSVPPEPNGGNQMDIRVFDLEGNERDFEYAREKYGVAFRRAEIPPGQKVYRLIELWEKTGNSALITQVLDENGNPMAGVDVAFYWPDAPDPPDPPTTVYPHDWHPNFTHGPTNVNGDIGPGMGKGAYHGRGEGGPHAVWVRDPNIPSDICEKLGMLAGTFHDHFDQKIQKMTVGEEPGPQPQPSGDIAVELDAMGDRLKEIAQVVGPGGVSGVVVTYKDGSVQHFSPVKSLLTRMLGR